jgi:hypothetical protein
MPAHSDRVAAPNSAAANRVDSSLPLSLHCSEYIEGTSRASYSTRARFARILTVIDTAFAGMPDRDDSLSALIGLVAEGRTTPRECPGNLRPVQKYSQGESRLVRPFH